MGKDRQEIEGIYAWAKTALFAAVGGGIAGAVAAAADPQKYRFPQDFGSGKLWPFFFQGFLLTLGALALKSPIGTKIVGSFKQSQETLKDSKATITETKAELTQTVTKKDDAKPSDSSKKS